MAGEERKILEAYLRERGQKMTGPRETVLDAFLRLESHVTAEELLSAARRIDPTIGHATVFRTIKLFAEAGLARGACPDEGARRFEHAYRHAHHDHLICVGCGAVVEFHDEALEKAQKRSTAHMATSRAAIGSSFGAIARHVRKNGYDSGLATA